MNLSYIIMAVRNLHLCNFTRGGGGGGGVLNRGLKWHRGGNLSYKGVKYYTHGRFLWNFNKICYNGCHWNTNKTLNSAIFIKSFASPLAILWTKMVKFWKWITKICPYMLFSSQSDLHQLFYYCQNVSLIFYVFANISEGSQFITHMKRHSSLKHTSSIWRAIQFDISLSIGQIISAMFSSFSIKVSDWKLLIMAELCWYSLTIPSSLVINLSSYSGVYNMRSTRDREHPCFSPSTSNLSVSISPNLTLHVPSLYSSFKTCKNFTS